MLRILNLEAGYGALRVLKGLSLQQVDAIFSKNRTGGAKDDIRTWGDLGLEGEWKDKPISLYGRNAASGGTFSPLAA